RPQNHRPNPARGESADGVEARAGPHQLKLAVAQAIVQPRPADQQQPGGTTRGGRVWIGGGGHLVTRSSGSSASSISSSSGERSPERSGSPSLASFTGPSGLVAPSGSPTSRSGACTCCSVPLGGGFVARSRSGSSPAICGRLAASKVQIT